MVAIKLVVVVVVVVFVVVAIFPVIVIHTSCERQSNSVLGYDSVSCRCQFFSTLILGIIIIMVDDML